MRPRLSKGGHFVNHRSVKLAFLQGRDQWGLPQDLLLGGSVLVARSAEHGLPVQQAQVSQLLVEGLPLGEGRTREASEERTHSGVRGPCWEDGDQRLQQLYGVPLGLNGRAHKASVFLQKPEIRKRVR